MFGWEFPPHISGGLGTACLGLTTSLGKKENQIIFVVPKLYGDEFVENSTFISANSIPDLAIGSVRQDSKQLLSARITEGPVAAQEETLQIINVHSRLSPYNISNTKKNYAQVDNWSYELKHEQIQSSRSPDLKDVNVAKDAGSDLSGSYGNNLFDEVEKYARVGEALARQNTFDVIHAHDWMTFLAGISAKAVSGKPLIVQVHSTEYDRSGENVDPFIYKIEKQGMEEADCVVAVSNWTKDIIVQRYHIDHEKVRVVHNGIIPKPVGSERSLPFPKFWSHTVTFLGQITHQKGPFFFVEAAKQVLTKFPDAHFVVAGSGDLLPDMIGLAASFGIASHFHFTGFLANKEVERLWSTSDVYVMPSVSEPFGIAPLEAIQGGVPVIISNQSGVAEVMPHAIKIDYWNSLELAAAICSVLKYKGLSKSLVRNSARALETITWDLSAEKLTKLYDEYASG